MNIRSMNGIDRRKIVQHRVETSDSQVVFQNETWLDDSIHDDTLSFPGFKIAARSDRKMKKKGEENINFSLDDDLHFFHNRSFVTIWMYSPLQTYQI